MGAKQPPSRVEGGCKTSSPCVASSERLLCATCLFLSHRQLLHRGPSSTNVKRPTNVKYISLENILATEMTMKRPNSKKGLVNKKGLDLCSFCTNLI